VPVDALGPFIPRPESDKGTKAEGDKDDIIATDPSRFILHSRSDYVRKNSESAKCMLLVVGGEGQGITSVMRIAARCEDGLTYTSKVR
jgi:tRNA G18 (ribose-2'-O)-methylase SpoU